MFGAWTLSNSWLLAVGLLAESPARRRAEGTDDEGSSKSRANSAGLGSGNWRGLD
jgi:hypothetical protein